MKKSITLFLSLITFVLAIAQNQTVRGVLRDKESQSVIAGAKVYFEGPITNPPATFEATTNNKAMEAEEIGATRHAKEDYEAALGLDPHCLAALYNYSEMLLRMSQYSQAERYLSRLLLMDTCNAKAWGVRAMCYEGTSSFDKAVVCYENALRIDDTSETRLRNFAVLMVEMQNFERAKALYEDLIAMDPRNGVVIGEYADMLHSMELKTEAAAAFERALATRNVNSTVINDYAVLLRKMSKENKDPSLLKKATKLINSIPNPSIYERMNQLNMNSNL